MALSEVLNGTFFDIKVRTSEGPDVYTLFTEVTSFGYELTRAEIDVSSKASGGNFQGLPGQFKETFTVDAFLIDGDATTAVLEAAIRGAGVIRCRRFQNGVEVDQFDAIITSFSRTAGVEDAATYSVSGSVCGQAGAIV